MRENIFLVKNDNMPLTSQEIKASILPTTLCDKIIRQRMSGRLLLFAWTYVPRLLRKVVQIKRLMILPCISVAQLTTSLQDDVMFSVTGVFSLPRLIME